MRAVETLSRPPYLASDDAKWEGILKRGVYHIHKDLGVDESGFLRFLKILFAQKRKTISNNLKAAYTPKAAALALAHTGIAPSARAEAISLEEMAPYGVRRCPLKSISST